MIRHPSEIRKLQEYCDYVFVEKEGRLWGEKKDPFRASFGRSKRNRYQCRWQCPASEERVLTIAALHLFRQ